MITEKMVENDDVTQIMLGMVDKKARELYSEILVEYGTNPSNYGVLSAPDGYAKITGPCGDTVEIFLRVKNGRVEESKFTTDGCVFSIAAVETATRLSTGRDMAGCLLVNQSAILNVLERMPADHQHCALLAAMTLQKAVKDYRDRQREK